jgi:putative membrane-bound dehydrogenase-like protein
MVSRCLAFLLWLCGFVATVTADDRPLVSPLSPEESLRHFEIFPDHQIELVAAEPDVVDPVHIAFDHRGRMWVCEYSDYPNGPDPEQPGKSRIRILTDADSDGRYDNPVTFADQLLFANGLMPWKDGVIATVSGRVLFLRDTDGDDRCDDTQEWFVGFTEENPQLRANHPTFALDGWVYVANGLRGGNVVRGKDWERAFGEEGAKPQADAEIGEVGGEEMIAIGGRDFRFHPITGAAEAVTGVGQFGLAFDDYGNRFVCDNRHPCRQIMFEDWHLKRNPHVTIPEVMHDVLKAGEESRLYPISRTWTTSNLHANQFTAACGLCIYRGTALAPELYGSAFVCDPTANLVHAERLVPDGATFRGEPLQEGKEFLATRDEWFRPVNLTVGPDGALYVVDMYRAVIEHPQFMPEELQNRPDLMLGTDRGRIYRIVAQETPPAMLSNLPGVGAPDESLFQMLGEVNAWQREVAHRLVSERMIPPQRIFEQFANWRDEPGRVGNDSRAPIHFAWLLSNGREHFDSWGNPDELPLRPREDGSWLDETTARILSVRRGPIDLNALSNVIHNDLVSMEDPALRFQLVLGLIGTDGGKIVSRTLGRLVSESPDERWLADAVALAANDPAVATRAMLFSPGTDARRLPHIERFAESAARRQSLTDVDAILAVPQDNIAQQFATVIGVGRGLRAQGKSLTVVRQEFSAASQSRIDEDFQTAVDLLDTPDSPALPNAIKLLAFAPWEQAQVLLTLAGDVRSPAARRLAIEVLGQRGEPEIGSALLAGFAGLSPELRTATLTAMFSNRDRLLLLLDEIESGAIPPGLIDATRVQQLTSSGDELIRSRSAAIFAALAPADRTEVLEQYQASLALESDPLRGREIFRAQCVTCHKIGDLGVDVAPDISDSRIRTREYLLTAILDPNRAIDNNYYGYLVMDTSGQTFSGILASETATSVTLKQPEGKLVTVPRDEIDILQSSGVSLMPVGLERNITPQQMADLLSFLKNWRYLDGSVPEEVIR